MADETIKDESDYLAPSKAAQALGISTRTLRRMVHDGRIASMQLPSGHRRFHRDVIDSMLKPGDAA